MFEVAGMRGIECSGLIYPKQGETMTCSTSIQWDEDEHFCTNSVTFFMIGALSVNIWSLLSGGVFFHLIGLITKPTLVL